MAEPVKIPPPEPLKEPSRQWRLLRRLSNLARSYIARLLRVEEEHKPQIYKDTFRSAEFADLNYWLEIIFSIGIATLGLIINSPAVVIGAMLISPLMGPIIASGLAIALGDFYLGFKAIVNVILSTLGSILLAALITWVLPFRAPTPEILARVQPTLLDLGVAVLSGMAGAIVVCRGGRGGGVTALPGVAVAVALMPPLGVVGFGVGIGWDWRIISGGGLLFLTNLVAIIMSSFLVFFSVRMDSPAARAQINEWLEGHERAEAFYEAIQRTPLRRLLGRVGSLPQRVLILLLFLAMVSWPLGRTLAQLRQEAQVRRMVFDELYKVVPRENIFQQELEVLPNQVRLRVVAMLPEGFPLERRRELEQIIRARAEGRTARVLLYDVATREELAELTGRLGTRIQTPVETVEEVRAKLWARVRPAIAAVWASERAPLAGYRLVIEPEAPGLSVHLAYLSEQELGPLGEENVRKAMRERAGAATLDLAFERIPPQIIVSFRGGSDALSAAARQALGSAAATLRRFPQMRCVVQAPAADGAEPAAIAQRRQQRVRAYLVDELRVPADRIETGSAAGARDSVVVRFLPPAQP